MKATKVKKKLQVSKSKPALFEKILCPVCRNKSFTVKYPGKFPDKLTEEFLKQTYRSSSDQELFEQVVQCTKCGTVYLNPRLNPEMIIESYSEGEDASFIAQDSMRIRTFEKALRHLAHQYNIPLKQETKVLDVGCAGGAFLLAAENLGLSTVGIEPNRWMCEQGRSEYQLDLRPGVLSDHHFPDTTFDVITLWDVIEHVPNPDRELREIYRILKPNGLLIINYPDYQSFPARILKRKWPFWLSVHLTYYTPKTIRKHLSDNQFTVLSIHPHWQTLELSYVLKRMTPYFPLARIPKNILEKIGLGNIPITYWMGQTQVVARKKNSL